MPASRSSAHQIMLEARRAANRRAGDRARERGLVQRSVLLPAECWAKLRAARAPGESTDAQTIARLLKSQLS